MRTADRVEVLLAGVQAEDRIRLRPVQWAADFLGLSVPTIYRLVAAEGIPHVKVAAGARRGGRGQAGRVLFRLADLVAWSQEREVAAPVTSLRGRPTVAQNEPGGPQA
jgi:excisionase family DNA binding protein